MSWNFDAIGTPEAIIRALDNQSARLTGDSKEEFDSAKPHLAALAAANFNEEGQPPPTLRITANGHGWRRDGKFVQSQVGAEVQRLGAILVALLVLAVLPFLAGCNPSPPPAAANEWTAPISWEIAHATLDTPAPSPAPLPIPPDNGARPGSPAASAIADVAIAGIAEGVPPQLAAAICPSGRCPLTRAPTVLRAPNPAHMATNAGTAVAAGDRPRLLRPRTWRVFRRR